MALRKVDVFLFSLSVVFCLFLALFADASVRREGALPVIKEMSEKVGTLELTDLCIFTEARYTRNPSMADIHAPFQDHPVSFEHFPSGSLITPPPHLRFYVRDR